MRAVVRSPTPTTAHSGPSGRQPVVDERETRRRAATAVAGFAAILIPLILVAATVLQGPGATAIHNALTLPDRVHACGRNYHGPGAPRPIADIRADGTEPVLVDTGWLGRCPAGACTTVATDAPCATVVYVRAGEDAYVAYELLGGP